MPTYAENAKQRDIKARRQAQDARDAIQHRAFDLQAQDKTAKFERPRFSVVGEGSRSANENYLIGYERIFPACRRVVGFPPSSLARPDGAAAG